LYLDKGVDSSVDSPGYYELVGFLFTKELQDMLKCSCGVIVVSLGLLRGFEKHIFNNKVALFSFATIPKVYRWQRILFNAVCSLLIFILVNSLVIAPFLMIEFQAAVFALALSLSPGYTFQTMAKLPAILPTVQYVEGPIPQSQRRRLPQEPVVIVKVGNGVQLYQQKSQKVLQDQVTELRVPGKTYKFDGDKSKLVPISDSVGKDILSRNNPDAKVKSVIDVKTEVIKNIVKETKTRHQYEPLSQRTKTLKDIEHKITKGEYIEAEIYERKVEERFKSKSSGFLKIDNK
jgi:hypothetical protein